MLFCWRMPWLPYLPCPTTVWRMQNHFLSSACLRTCWLSILEAMLFLVIQVQCMVDHSADHHHHMVDLVDLTLPIIHVQLLQCNNYLIPFWHNKIYKLHVIIIIPHRNTHEDSIKYGQSNYIILCIASNSYDYKHSH